MRNKIVFFSLLFLEGKSKENKSEIKLLILVRDIFIISQIIYYKVTSLEVS